MSSKYQVVIPVRLRKAVGLNKGSKLTAYQIGKDHILLGKRPKNHLESMVGLGKEIWDELGGVDKYLEEERNSWGDR